jgi:hypothetical protein
MKTANRLRPVLSLLLAAQLGWPPGAAASLTDGSTQLSNRQGTGKTEPSFGGPLGSSDAFTGTARFSVPMVLPPGTGGIQPALELSYSSGNRSDSWVGYGWTLGFGSIQRTLEDGVPCLVVEPVCTTPPVCPPIRPARRRRSSPSPVKISFPM